jgi:hypothetical protein
VAADDEHFIGDPLQQIDLPNDDGETVDHELALVAAAETAGASAGDNGARSRRSSHELIMTEVLAGHLIAASLSEAILEVLPQRLEFYEPWLGGERRPDRRGNLAQMLAVIGFLRTEGGAYDRVVAHAGRLAAGWIVDELPPWRRRMIGRLPRPFRARAALGVAADLVRAVHEPSRLSRKVRRRRAEVGVTTSLFCEVREAPHAPLCGFYLAATIEVLARFGIQAEGRLSRCHAIDSGPCVMHVDWSGRQSPPGPAAVA